MATYTTRNGLIKPVEGEFVDDWGDQFNAGQTNLVDEALDGVEAVTVSGTVTLTATNGASNQARNRILVLTGSGGQINIPSVEKWYFITNGATGDVVVKPSGTGYTLPPGAHAVVYCDGTNATRIKIGAPESLFEVGGNTGIWTLDTTRFNKFDLWVRGYSHNSGGNADLTFSMKESGGSFTNFNTLLGTLAASATVNGRLTIQFEPGQSTGIATGLFASFTAGGNAVVAATRTEFAVYRYQSSSDIQLVWSAGAVDAGFRAMYAFI